MACSHCTVFSLLLPSNNPITRRTYPLLVVSSIPTSNPSRVRYRRKNHLRPKILKTLTKSHPPITPLPPQESPHNTEVDDDSRVEVPSDEFPSGSIAAAAGEGGDLEELPVSVPSGSIAAAAGEGDELEELPASEMTGTSGEFDGIAGKLSAKSILKYGAILFGAFVLQTIFSVFIILDDDSKKKCGDTNVTVREKRSVLFDGSGKNMRVTGGSGVINLKDRLEMDKKIEEIKLMAREAGRIEGEKKEEEIEDSESDGESVVSGNRLGIEKEIGARLLKLQDRVNSDKDKSALLNVMKNLGTSVNSTGAVVKDNKNVNKGNEALMFKKKLKYKIPSTKPRKAPKGFSGTRDHKASDAETRDSSSKDKAKAQENRSTATDHVQISHDVEAQETDSRLSLEDGGKLVDEEANTLPNTGKNLEELMARPNEGTETRVENNRGSNGGFPEDSFGRSSVEVTQNSRGNVEENQDANPNFEKGDEKSINGNPKHGIADNVSAAKNVEVKQANAETDMWWLNLRYVLVIIMRRGPDKEGPSGLYSLKMTSQEEEQNDYSYIVAFEDHADANNFCFLLESFFEDLGDFSADAVPMSIQELHQAVKSHAKKVIVVKKRQLKFYAGQPLSDVEETLYSLVEQCQNVRLADSK